MESMSPRLNRRVDPKQTTTRPIPIPERPVTAPDERREKTPVAQAKSVGKTNRKPTYGLNLNRFSIPVELVDIDRCSGYDDGKVAAEMEIVTDNLDARGFVTDNGGFLEIVNLEFADGPFKASCEEIAAGLINLTTRLVGDNLVVVNAKVYNSTGSVTVIWRRGSEIPPFPRKATRTEIKEREKAKSREKTRTGC